MQIFFKPALIMVSTFLLIYLIAFIVQSDFNKNNQPANFIKVINVSAMGRVSMNEKKEIVPAPAPIVYDIPHKRIDKAEKITKSKILPSGEVVP